MTKDKKTQAKVATTFLIFKVSLLILTFSLESAPVDHALADHTVEPVQVAVQVEEDPGARQMTDEELCDLKVIVCEDEQDVELALKRIPHETARTEELIRFLWKITEGTDVDPEEVSRTVYCESMWYNIPSGYYDENGVQEDSHGLAQIHLPSHPNITRDQAYDPYFALQFMVDRWHDVKWYGYDRETEQCTNPIVGYWL